MAEISHSRLKRLAERRAALALCFDAIPKGKREALSRENRRTLFLELLWRLDAPEARR
jgi:hypothetical protein